MHALMEEKIRVAILDDHQSVVEGYTYRLSANRNIQVARTGNYGSQLDDLVGDGSIDVLLLDVSLPNSEHDHNPFPILQMLPKLKSEHPQMAVLFISMHAERPLVRALLDNGANGYILKDDREAATQLAEVVTLVNTGGVYLSKQLRNLVSEPGPMDAVLKLSKRQLEALSIMAAHPDTTTQELAREMEIAPSTMRNLLSKTYGRLRVRNRTAAINRARQLGLITPYPPRSRYKKLK